MSAYKAFRSCPVCNSTVVNKVYRIDFALFDGHPMIGGYNVVQCDICGFMYADTNVTQAELDIYYKELSKYEDKNIGTGGGYTPEDKDRLYRAAKFIAENVADKNIRILDIGCANGGLLKELKQLGFNNLAGVDPSSECVENTKHEVGCDTYQYSVFDLGEDLGTFDLIILSHVLEHILDITAIMKRLSALLNDKGLIYAECPNAENYYKVIHAPLQEFNTEHINHFTETAFENLFGLHSFNKITTGNRVIKIASLQDYYAVYGLFEKNEAYKYEIKKDTIIHDNILQYIQKSEQLLKSIEEELAADITARPIAFYGIGQFAFKLLAITVISKAQVKLFDNNSLNVGKTINGSKILAGNKIRSEFEKAQFSIIITSLIHEEGIRKSIEKAFEEDTARPAIIGFKKYLPE